MKYVCHNACPLYQRPFSSGSSPLLGRLSKYIRTLWKIITGIMQSNSCVYTIHINACGKANTCRTVLIFPLSDLYTGSGEGEQPLIFFWWGVGIVFFFSDGTSNCGNTPIVFYIQAVFFFFWIL